MVILYIAYYRMIASDLFRITSLQFNLKHNQSKLSIAELAEMLGVSNPELARLFNERIGMNFFELVKIDKAQNLTFFGLAQEAGFHSKTTFIKAFKNLMGTSPSAYFNKTLS